MSNDESLFTSLDKKAAELQTKQKEKKKEKKKSQ